MFLDYFALFLVFFVAIVMFYGIIVVHDIPYEIAVKRNHPHQDALHVAGWISLFTLGVIWPFLWIWATIYKPGVGWGFKDNPSSEPNDSSLQAEMQLLKKELAEIKSTLEQSSKETPKKNDVSDNKTITQEKGE